MRKLIMKMLSFVNAVVPKKNRIIFASFPSLSGNAMAIYMYILENRPDILQKYELVWSVSNADYRESIKRLATKRTTYRHRVVRRSAVLGIFTFMRSRYVVSTHGLYPEISSPGKQKHINLWHGMPFKKIGKALRIKGEKENKADITIATSEIFQEFMAQAFGIKKQNVLVTGQPCNDVLRKNSDVLKKLGIEKQKYHHIILWMPTYRKSVVGEIRTDGNLNAFGVYDVLTAHREDLNECLRRKGYLLLIKPHPMDAICKMQFKDASNIRIIANELLEQKNILLYELLSESTVLLTDYSSVFVDYLVTGKPMAFVCDDMDVYGDSRGFFFENPRQYMPGELIEDYSGLKCYFEEMDAVNSRWRSRYQELSAVLNCYADSDASKRVCDAIWGEILEA